jgi:adenylate cyclase
VAWLLALAVIGVSIYASILARRYLREREEGERVRSMFSRYLPDVVVDDLLARKDARLFEGKEYYATILCCNIWNFPLFAEDLSPQEMLRYLNEFYNLAGQAVTKHNGMIESLRGDGITAVFGVLIDAPFQEERAIRAALDIVRLVSAMNARWQAQGRKPFRVGIGLNSGNIIAGDTGYEKRREFSLVGNDVQIAARLQEATEEMNAAVIASATTFRPVAELFVGLPIKSIPLRGMKRLQQAYVVRGLSKRTPEDPLTLPPDASFATTEIKTEPLIPVAAEPAKPPFVFENGPPPVNPSTPAPPERRFSSLDDDKPAMPEAPPAEQTYEDDSGPPLQL